MKVRALLAKDLRVLVRSPRVLVLLAFYPALVALLIGLAVGRPPDKPKIALYNQIPQEQRVINIGGKRFNIDKIVKVIYKNVDVIPVDSRAEAVKAVSSGEAVAAIVLPAELVNQLESSLESGYIEAIYDNSNPVRRSYVENTVKGLLVDTNRELSSRFSDVVLGYVTVIVDGGTLRFGFNKYKVQGFKDSQDALRKTIATAPPETRGQLEQLLRSVTLAKRGLNYSDQLLNRVGEPIKPRNRPVGRGGSLPIYAIAVATSVSLMFVALLLGAGMLAYEQEDRMLSRLLRGLASARQVVTEKTLVAGLCAFVMGTIMLVGFGIFADIRWERAWQWVPALGVSAVGFAAAGVAIGALTDDVRAASLLSFMVGLPLAVAALVPSGSVSPLLYDVFQAVSACFPFKPALGVIEGSLSVGKEIAVPLAHLLIVTVLYAALGVWSLRRSRAAL